jgi:hypothetical protein
MAGAEAAAKKPGPVRRSPPKVDLDRVQADVEQLVGIAVEAATSLEELVEVANAAASISSRDLLEAVAEKLAAEVETSLRGAGAWEAELIYSKNEAWGQTGHRARLLAETWAVVSAALAEAPPSRRPRPRP